MNRSGNKAGGNKLGAHGRNGGSKGENNVKS